MKKDLRDDQAASTGAEAKTTRFVTTAEVRFNFYFILFLTVWFV
jgi:hypothetical protein